MVLHHRTCLPSSLVWPTQILNGDFDYQKQRHSVIEALEQFANFLFVISFAAGI